MLLPKKPALTTRLAQPPAAIPTRTTTTKALISEGWLVLTKSSQFLQAVLCIAVVSPLLQHIVIEKEWSLTFLQDLLVRIVWLLRYQHASKQELLHTLVQVGTTLLRALERARFRVKKMQAAHHLL